MSTTPEILPLLSVELRSEHDLVLCRQRARQFGEGLGFGRQAQTAIATAVSEIARNAFDYASGGRVEFKVETLPHPSRNPQRSRQSLLVLVKDNGPGIAHLAAVLSGSHQSENGLGIGIQGARRLMNEVEFATTAKGTAVTLRKTLPPESPRLTGPQIQAIIGLIDTQKAFNPLEEVQRQNQELMRVMADLQEQQDQISRANKELEETNSGVLALYDELETLHRVSLLLATKVDLLALIQAVIDATTELTSANFGLFLLRETEVSAWTLFAKSGRDGPDLDALPASFEDDLLGVSFGTTGLEKVDDLSKEDGAGLAGSQLVKLLGSRVQIRSCLAVPVVDGQGLLLGALFFASGRAEAFIERSERIVSSIATQAVVAIEKARLFDSVKAASEAKDRFMAMLSHELRTPLNPVMAIVSSLYEDASLPLSIRDDMATVLRNVQLEARIIDDLLDFQRLINGKLDLRLESVNLHEMIHNVLGICQPELVQSRHLVDLHLSAENMMVSGDPARLQQALWNVLKNAIKFTPVGGKIKISTENRMSDRLAVIVNDTGKGIEAEAIPGIFDAFEQGGKAVNSEFGGLGLGLAITRTFLEKHQGTVTAESAGPNQGTTITMELPWIAGETPQDTAAKSDAATKTGSSVAAAILLVDDHADTLNTLSRLLVKRGYDVSTAATCTQALQLVASKPFDLVVSDLGLPDRSGLDLIAEIRKDMQIPAIALSGFGMESDVTHSIEAGFTEHLTKPVRIQVLHEAIDRLLSKPG